MSSTGSSTSSAPHSSPGRSCTSTAANPRVTDAEVRPAVVAGLGRSLLTQAEPRGRCRRRCGPRRACRSHRARRRPSRPAAAAPSCPSARRCTPARTTARHRSPHSAPAGCAAVREQQLVKRAQAVATSVDVPGARRLAGVAVRFECRHDRVDIARRERTLIVAYDIWLAQLRIGLQQRWAVGVPTGERPATEVDS